MRSEDFLDRRFSVVNCCWRLFQICWCPWHWK